MKLIWLPHDFRKGGANLFGQQVFLSLLEIVSIGSIFPILFLIVDPDVTVRESKTKQIYDFLGFTSHDAFFITMVALFCLFVVAIHVYKFWLHRYMFDFLARLQKHVEKTRHDMLLQTDPDQVTGYHPPQESRIQLSLGQRYVAYFRNLLGAAKGLFSLVFVLVVLAWYDWKLVCGMLLLGLVYYILTFFLFRKKSKSIAAMEVELSGGIHEFWQETIQSHYLFFLGAPYQSRIATLQFLQKRIQNVRFRKMIYTFLPRLLLESFFVMGVLFFVLHTFLSGQISFVPFLVLFGVGGLRALMAMDQVYQNTIHLSMLAGISDDVRLTHDTIHRSKNVISPAPTSSFSTFEVRDLTFHYLPTNPLFSAVHLCIRRGSSTLFLGRSGSGKTTLLELMAGLRRPLDGTLSIDGKEVSTLVSNHIRVGYVPQKGKIISGTLQDNIAFGVKHEQVDSDQIHECMRIACVDDFFSDLSDGLQTNLGNDGVNISMGQRQRVLLARELYRDPVVLFLDESTSFLDDTTSRNVLQNLLSTDVTLVCTSHKLWMADLFDSVYEFVGSGPVTLQLQTK